MIIYLYLLNLLIIDNYVYNLLMFMFKILQVINLLFNHVIY